MISERAALAKVRARVRREHAAAEEAEFEGGELNLVPYLDIITNTVIFLLATTASVIAMANINVNAPRYADPSVAAGSEQRDSDDTPKLNLTVTVSYTGFIIAGSGAVLTGDDGKLPTIKCLAPLQQRRCPIYLGSRTNADGQSEPVWIDKLNYAGLVAKVRQIKKTYPKERQVILMADRNIPYQAVVKTMDVLRGTPTSDCTGGDGCLFDQVILSAGVE